VQDEGSQLVALALADAEVDAGIGTITDALADHLGGRIRS